ncbi:uncharacterized protein LOC124271823 [Haliotis rubra]|uniref:uncharacterized protein LOC124271823 n=1 Tax=Haliotis rubra TaxID=36100 RepID=UPI001EE58146|nr:uncharacterized protein LOC124271823 [Haliotis rubra]
MNLICDFSPVDTNYVYLAAGLVCQVALLVLNVRLMRHVEHQMLKKSSTQQQRALDGNVYSSDRSNLDETQTNVTFHEDTTTDMKSVDIRATANLSLTGHHPDKTNVNCVQGPENTLGMSQSADVGPHSVQTIPSPDRQNNTRVRSLASGTGGDDTPVRSLASGTGRDERTSRDTLLQSDISQTSSETEDEDFSADTDSHSSQSDIALEVPRDAVPKGESVYVQAFVSPEFHKLQPFMDDDEVVVSPVGEFQMSCKRKWDRHVKIHIPCIQRNPKETFRVRFFQKNSSGSVEFGDVPVKEDGLNQELYYAKKENHVEIFTVHFTGFFCSVCGHTCPLDLLALVFGCYGHHSNEAWITLVVGDRRISIPEVRQKIIDKEKALNGSELVAERPVRLVEAYDCQSRLMFTLHVRSHAEMWRNADTDSGDKQVRRLRELIKCSCSHQPNVTSSEFESHHQCEDNLQWVYSCDDPPLDSFSCKILVEHLLNGDVVTPRHDACNEGVTRIIVPPVKLQRPQHSEKMKSQDLPPMGFGELTSSKKPLFSHGTTFSSTRPPP